MTTINSIMNDYVVYLIEEYLKLNPEGKTDHIYVDLAQYRDRGLINGLIYPKTTMKGRLFIFNLYRNKIELVGTEKGVDAKIMAYEQFHESRSETEK